MKYKVGDRVRIKTWEKMEKEFGLNQCGNIKCSWPFMKEMENELNRVYSDRIVEILKTHKDLYDVKNIECIWTNDMIEGLASETEPINSRFEILDI